MSESCKVCDMVACLRIQLAAEKQAREKAEAVVESVPAALKEYRCQFMQYDDGDGGMALVDVFSMGSTSKTIKPGIAELELLADFIQSYSIEAAANCQPRRTPAEIFSTPAEKDFAIRDLTAQLAAERAAREAAEAACAAMAEQVRKWNESVETVIGRQPDTGIEISTLGRPLLDELARLRRYRLPDDEETSGVKAFIADLRGLASPEAGVIESLTKQAYAELADLLEYLSEHHDECHQPAANYQLLLDRLAGVPTNHGDCPVAKRLDELAKLRGVLGNVLEGIDDHWQTLPENAETMRIIIEAAALAAKEQK